MSQVIYKGEEGKEDDMVNIPEEVWQFSRKHEVYVEDKATGELVRVLDLKGDDLGQQKKKGG